MSFLLNTASTIACPHGGSVRHTPIYGLAMPINGQPICLKEDKYSISGCPLSKNQCRSVKWGNDPSGFLLYGLYQVLTMDSFGLCVDQQNSPTGRVRPVSSQTTVSLEDFQGWFKTR